MTDDDGPDIQWCTAPGCVRPVTYHPDGIHLTEQGQEFSDAQPTPRPRLRLVQHQVDPWRAARAQGGTTR